jgi:ubiquinone/menaquinone biosynthesis C-methylase UbiE
MKPTALGLLPPFFGDELHSLSRQFRSGLEQVFRLYGWLTRVTRPSQPPCWLNPIGDGDFVAVGNYFKRHLIELAGLQPHHRILDVGCGVGRIALPLAQYLTDVGGYEGLDIVRAGIDWCTKHITAQYPHFRFRSADLYNQAYHPRGRARASEFTFPYADASFDCVLVASVFTHMLPEDLEHYLAEIARVLQPNGRCLATFFLLNDESRRLMNQPASLYAFKHQLRGCFTKDRRLPESAIAYEESVIRELYRRYNLTIAEPIYYGSWCGRQQFRDGQDMIVATRDTHVSEMVDSPSGRAVSSLS